MEFIKDKLVSLPEEEQRIADFVQIFTVFLDSENRNESVSHRISPSCYIKQMLLTTEERTESLIKREHKAKLDADPSSVPFRVIPSIVIFQQFSPGSNYSVALTIKNITSVSQYLKMVRIENPWFRIESNDTTYRKKLAPGMSVVYDVKFCPEERRDYKHQATFSMGSDVFVIPILAIGPRPLLDFPDTIELPKTPVKALSSKCLLVRNISDVSAAFSLTTNSPFTVYPRKGNIAEGAAMQVTVNFLYEKSGCFRDSLLVTYDTGEIISLDLCGMAISCAITLEKSTIVMKETYFGLTTSTTFTIRNGSDYILNFQWVQYADRRRDELRREVYQRSFEMLKNMEISRKVDLDHYNVGDTLVHELACQRVYTDQLFGLPEQTFSFHHPSYRLIPSEGQIWPHSEADITLIFEPNEIGVIESKAYLEITGSEERICLKLRGTCIGPLVRLNVICVDVGPIFLCSNHHFEVICGNKGDIPGTLVHAPRTLDFGGKIEVNPAQVKLEPGEYKSFDISLSSNRNGVFVEMIEFVIKESLEVISLTIKGSVVCPTLHFDKQSLDFGTTALGFTTKREVCLHNSSLVPVTFCLTATQDGTQPSLTYQDFARCPIKPVLIANPKEFTLVPSEGVVAPNSFQRIKISYTPNIVRCGQTAIRADMWDSDSVPVTLPIIFSSKVASLTVKPCEIHFRFCFINFPYTRFITVENNSDVEAYFYLPPQPVMTSSTVMYSLSAYQGYLKPYEWTSISLKIITTTLGRQKVQLSLLAFGDKSLAPCCTVTCNGQGPVVTVQPMVVNWGEVRLLEPVKKTITLFSDAPIVAQFVAALHKKPSPWTVSPASGALEPNKSLELEITLYLRDTGKYLDRVDIEIMNSRIITCSLNAVGIGTSIELDPNIIPVFDIGFLFRDEDISIPITIANKGTRHHRLVWTTTEESQVLQKSGKHEQQHDKFTVDPHILELPPGTNAIVHCRIRWQTKESIAEQWYLHGQIKGYGRREVLATSLFRATFIDPHVIFSKRKLMFRYDMSASENETQITDELFVTNRSRLDLRAWLQIDPPFEILMDDEDDGLANTNIDLRDDTPNRICVRFNIQAMKPLNLYSRKFNGILTFQYENHRAKDKIKCIAELNYPNISILPTKLAVLNSDFGSTAYKNLILANPGHLPVRYCFEHLADDDVGIASTRFDHVRCLQSTERIAGKSTLRDFSSTEEQGAEQEAKNEEDPENSASNYLFERLVPEITKLAIPSARSVDVAAADLVYTIGSTSSTTAQGDEWEKERTLGSIRLLDSIDTDNSTEKKDKAQSLASTEESDIQDLIFAVIERYFHKDSEISALEDSQKATTDFSLERQLITEMLEVVPREGIILPYSSQYGYFEFNALSRVGFNAKVACHLLSGPTEMIEVQALCDTIGFSIDPTKIDFHYQLPGKSCRARLTIVNHGLVGFNFATYLTPAPSSNVESRELVKGTEQRVNVDRLKVEPRCGLVNPMSRSYLDIIYYSGIPGRIREKFDLEIAYHPPVSICIEGYVSAPQVYLNIPRDMVFSKLPVYICYRAIAAITTEFLNQLKSTRHTPPLTVEKGLAIDDRSQGYSLISENDRQLLLENGWVIITCDETLPTAVDVEMAIERLLFIEYVRDNAQLSEKYDESIKKRDASSLLVPEYVIDMGHVVVEQTTCYSTSLFNYGPIPVDIRMKKSLNKFGIYVLFDQGKTLPVGESTPLNVTFNPTRSKYTEQQTVVEHTIYLEVSHGSTIPISIKAIATYPCLTVQTNYLSFGQVAVGNCMLIPVLLRNSGWVPCEWRAKIRYKDSGRWKEGTGGPFFLHNSADTFLPGNENVVNVYFKPKEPRYFEGQLRVQICKNISPILVTMSGQGIEPQLQVSDVSLRFQPTVPYDQPVEKTFLVKNLYSYPVIVFWKNFDTEYIDEECMIRSMMHYYGVDELLFPLRLTAGQQLSSIIRDCYRSLCAELLTIFGSHESDSTFGVDTRLGEKVGKEQEVVDKDGLEEVNRIDSDLGTGLHRLPHKGEIPLLQRPQGSMNPGKGRKAFSSDKMFEISSQFSVDDPKQVEALLDCYIDESQERGISPKIMRDPMAEVPKEAEIKPPSANEMPLSGPCIIFHGAPFTEYQRVACQVAKSIGIPVLNINNALVEVIAFGKSDCCCKLREIVDRSYDVLLKTSEPYRSSPDATDNDEVVAGHPVSLKSAPGNSVPIAGEYNTNTTKGFIKFSGNSDALEEFNKIHPRGYVESMDLLNEYEYKIQSVLLLQRIISPAMGEKGKNPRTAHQDVANDQTSEKNIGTGAKKPHDGKVFLDIDSDLIYEALKQRLCMPDFHPGFALETMDNIFITSEVDTLLMVLRIVGNAKPLLFVICHNTLNTCLARNAKLAQAEDKRVTEELRNKVTAIEEMTSTEYEQVSEDSKLLYAEHTLSGKRADRLRIRSIYKERLMAVRSHRKIKVSVEHAPIATAKRANKKSNAKATPVDAMKSLRLKSNESEALKLNESAPTKVFQSTPENTSVRAAEPTNRDTVKKGLKEISKLMDAYQMSLAALQPVLDNWDPRKGTYIETTAKNRTPKTVRAQDIVQQISQSNGLDVWYVAPADPWNSKLYEAVTSHLADNYVKFVPGAVDTLEFRPRTVNESLLIAAVTNQSRVCLDSRLYTVVDRSSAPSRTLPGQTSAYTLTSTGSSFFGELGSDATPVAYAMREIRPNESELVAGIIGEPLKPRWIMQPNEVSKFKIQFSPKTVGTHKQEYELGTVGSNVSRQIAVTGVSDIPTLSIDPNVTFSKVEESKPDNSTKPAFFLDIESYDFGSILLDKAGEERVLKRKAQFTLSNISSVAATTDIFCMDNTGDFGTAAEHLNVEPGESNILDVWAQVHEAGLNLEHLLFCTRNNPRVKMIELRSYGAKLEVELEGQLVSFGKMLLWTRDKRTIVVKNKSNVTFYWNLDFGDNLTDNQVALYPEKGTVPPLATINIECTYYAETVGIVDRSVSFQAFSEERDEEPLLANLIKINGENYDVNVDVINAAPINFKTVQVGTVMTETFSIRNRGPYDIGFIVQLDLTGISNQLELNLPLTLTEDLTLEPPTGCLSPGESTTIKVKLVPRVEFTIVKVPLLKCQLVDTYKTANVVAELPILLSISAFYAKFKIQPSLGLDFGPVAIFDTKIMALEVENVGRFPLQYKIQHVIQRLGSSTRASSRLDKGDAKERSADKIDKLNRSKSERSPAGKSKTDKNSCDTGKGTKSREDQQSSCLRMGPFLLSKVEGEVEPGKLETVKVQCCPDSAVIFQEEVVVFVPNAARSTFDGEPLKLSATGCVPTIDLCNFHAIFPGSLIVNRITDLECPCEFGTHSVFDRQEKCLYIRHVKLLSTYAVHLRLYNPGLVLSNVTANIAKDGPIYSEYGSGPFDVQPVKSAVTPMSAKIFTVSFTPTTLGCSVVTLNIVHELSVPLKNQEVDIRVCGEGVVPKIALVEPTTPNVNDRYILNFGCSVVGETGNRLLCFKNIGCIEAKVIVRINDTNGLFTFEDDGDDTGRSPKYATKDERRIVCRLMPKEVASVNVRFLSNHVGKYESNLQILTLDNPYEETSVFIVAESYAEIVIMEGLTVMEDALATSFMTENSSQSRKGSRYSQIKLPLATPTAESTCPITYKLDYGRCFVSEMKRIRFKVSNKSEKKLFRFELSSHPSVIFSPSAGYLYELETKDISATFLAVEPMVHTETQMECSINEVTRISKAAGDICWDDRQRNIQWDPSESDQLTKPCEQVFRKLVQRTTEPADFHVTPETTRIIRIVLLAIVAYSKYDCPVREINLKDTLMLQSCKYVFELKNSGVVDMRYQWDIDTDALYQTRLTDLVLHQVLSTLDNSGDWQAQPNIKESNETLDSMGQQNHRHSKIISTSIADMANEVEYKTQAHLHGSDVLFVKSSAVEGLVENHLPFDITPRAGVLIPGESIRCTFVFSPLDVFDYTACLSCRIENLDPGLLPLKITIRARSLLPYYHFELPQSDYFNSSRRDVATFGPLPREFACHPVGEIRVVEFKVIGSGLKHVKKFRMINPTTEDYLFSWCKLTKEPIQCADRAYYFNCVAPEGIAEHGKKTEFTFTFLAEEVGIYESFWIFSIEKFELKTAFLFVGTVTEPSVHLSPGHLTIAPTVVGEMAYASMTIFNKENIPLSFRIIPETLRTEDRSQCLLVKPMTGTLQPNKKHHLE